ncbi:MAG: hypothetical protein HDS16_06265 [Bacteroides sp.]|nr:hypothetical protein [Bacteroides sp.]
MCRCINQTWHAMSLHLPSNGPDNVPTYPPDMARHVPTFDEQFQIHSKISENKL